ncbi:Sterol-sensing domain protein [Ophiocordyceps sinensis CO18]|uniref:Sterol-sensing domain protein n=1 Tax=Ophiocordyceps sinensis (strain Co18 / CGMCC 3.14243) TaxID=911162 RepID=T5A645_OPHSC|nr:Sterol-sensing domain protein [Ophiocordyceps sinensis CO18]
MEPDITMRSMWVHASYMQALNADLLISALELQDHLLGITKNFSPARAHRSGPRPPGASHADALSLAQRDAVHVANGLTGQSWFFHSPLLYWSCSRERILADEDILSTVNDRKNQSTSANVTLRHSIVFSGKRFEDRRLLAADALVITLLHLRNSPVGREWEKSALELPQKVADKWNIYPADGRASSSQLYEFQFRPISVQDIITLALAYGLTLLYFLMSLSNLRAVKSKVGLIVTIMAQIIFSVMSSFTLCAIFKIDLSRIPRAAYPLVVLAMSLEHIFRLINAVILTPLEDSVSSRIGQAFGETAPTALASTLQNVLMLAGLSRLVSPGVSEFCVFAAIAIIFDFFYLSTFFLAVLSVDVRRMELGDALAKASMRRNRRSDGRASRRAWWDQVLHGKIAMSTRIAGTIVMFGFVLIAQWHFFGDDGLLRKLLRLYRGADPEQVLHSARSSPLEDIHQARSPTSWLRMQDHETAREVINIIKPSSYSYVARVYDPLVFVLKDSDRVPHSKEPTLLPAAYDFIHHESARFIVIVIVVIAALRLLTNFLLWEDDRDTKDQHELDDSPLMSVKSMAKGHGMDIILLTASADGLVVSVGLDHIIRVWSVRGMGMSYVIASGDEAAATIFPVIAIAIDDKSKWLGLLSRPKRAARAAVPNISFWNLKDRAWGATVHADSCRHRPVALFFDPSAPCHKPRALVVQHGGSLTEIVACESNERPAVEIFPEQLTCARMLARKEHGDSTLQAVILAVSRQGAVHMASRSTGAWRCRRLAIDGREEPDAHMIEVLPALDLFVVAAGDRVHLISGEDGLEMQTLQTERMLTRPLRCAYTCHRLSQAGPVGLTSFTLGYMEARSGDCILQTFVPRDDCDAIFLRTPCDTPDNDWCTWDSARETRKRVVDPGVWDVVSDGSAVGIRYIAPKSGAGQDCSSSGLRNRYGRRTPEPDPLEAWQIWAASSAGGRPEEDESQRLVKEGEQAEHLLVTELGPKARVGSNAVAFAFGDMVKLVIVGGHVRLDEGAENRTREDWIKTGSRRRKAGTGARIRTAI